MLSREKAIARLADVRDMRTSKSIRGSFGVNAFVFADELPGGDVVQAMHVAAFASDDRIFVNEFRVVTDGIAYLDCPQQREGRRIPNLDRAIFASRCNHLSRRTVRHTVYFQLLGVELRTTFPVPASCQRTHAVHTPVAVDARHRHESNQDRVQGFVVLQQIHQSTCHQNTTKLRVVFREAVGKIFHVDHHSGSCVLGPVRSACGDKAMSARHKLCSACGGFGGGGVLPRGSVNLQRSAVAAVASALA